MPVLFLLLAVANAWAALYGIQHGWPVWVVAINIVVTLLGVSAAVKDSA